LHIGDVKAVLFEHMVKYTENTKKYIDIHQQMPSQNHTPVVVRQGTQHYTLKMDQTTTLRK